MLSRFRKFGIKQSWDRKFVRTKSSGKDVIISDKDVLFSYKSKILNLENEGFTDVIIYNKGDLEAFKLKELQAMAKELKINLKGKRRKHQVVNIMFAYFLQLKSSNLDTEILPQNFTIATDINDNINISLWFKGTGNKFSRCINSKRFKDLVTLHCEIEKKQKNDVMVEINGELYVHPVIALYAASFLSTRVQYDILHFYLHTKFDKMREIYHSKIESLEQQVIVAQELGLKLDKTSRWKNLDAPYAFYYFVIGNVVKCGAVGLKDQKNPESLNARFASHRSTHARFILINVIEFKDSKTVTFFENLIKFVLEKYSIGTNTSLEQYECPEGNSPEIIDKIILKEFYRLNEMNPGLGSVWPKKDVKQYNETMVTKTNV